MNFYSLWLDLRQWLRAWFLPLLAGSSSYGILFFAQPPHSSPEGAYVFLLPSLIWLATKPPLKKVLIVYLVTGWLYFFFLVGWMRHISPVGMILATFLLSAYQLPWFWLAKILLPLGMHTSFFKRIVALLVLPCAWVVTEWIRCYFTLGFPWCPLSTTQWERPAILQTIPWFGAWVVSFFLVCFNLCVASYLHHLLVRRKKVTRNILSSLCPDLYFGLLLLFLMVSPFFLNRSISSEKATSLTIEVGICQPYLTEKWQQSSSNSHKEILARQTSFLGALNPDLIIWPEAATPNGLHVDLPWVKKLAQSVHAPLLIGATVKEGIHNYNSVVRIRPTSGMDQEWYAKRILVPFGEYVPFPFKLIPGLRKMVGPVGNFTAGEYPVFQEIELKDEKKTKISVGPLICYEDIFPQLTRDLVKGGSDIIFVTTNDAWFGEEGCAEQHASHSVLRALESGQTILRCGNSGLSGWIDSRGHLHDILRDENGSIYFQGASTVQVSFIPKSSTFYSKHGDFFPWICILITALFLVFNQIEKWKSNNQQLVSP
ncbi:MAG: apolipoprotein N-acyltransferase [Opitutae bacterium]|nr:apolipoprotein N-acyltransferase [Opitutae bacterium]